MIFDGWIGGLISYSNPILAHCIDEKLEVAYRTGLKTFLGLPISTATVSSTLRPSANHYSTSAMPEASLELEDFLLSPTTTPSPPGSGHGNGTILNTSARSPLLPWNVMHFPTSHPFSNLKTLPVNSNSPTPRR